MSLEICKDNTGLQQPAVKNTAEMEIRCTEDQGLPDRGMLLQS